MLIDIPEPQLTQLPFPAFRILSKQLINHGIEFHQAAIFPQIIFRLAQENVISTIAGHDGNLLRTYEGGHELN